MFRQKERAPLLHRPIIFLWKRSMLSWFPKHRVAKFMARNVINQNSSTACHFSANGASLCLGEAEMKIYERSLQPLLFLHPLRLHHSLMCSLTACFALLQLTSLAIIGELTHRLIKIIYIVFLGLNYFSALGFIQFFLEHSIREPKSSARQITFND